MRHIYGATAFTNPHYYLAAYTVKNEWVLWAMRQNALYDALRERPTEDDVPEWNRETLRALPKPIRLAKIPALR